MAHYLLVNHRHRFIVCLSPKCACTSLKQWFLETDPEPEPKIKGELGPYLIRGCNLADYCDYKRFLFVRDPLQRLVSFYCQFVVREPWTWCFADEDGKIPLDDKTFREFLQILLDLARARKHYQHHLLPQVTLSGITDLLCIEPKFQLVPIDDLNRELGKINAGFGISFLPPRANARIVSPNLKEYVYDLSPHELRKSDQPSWTYFYDDALRLLASQLYAHDLACYQMSVA